MNTPQSDTPRTDEAKYHCTDAERYNRTYLDAEFVVTADFAEKLERELNAEKQLLLRACEDSTEDRDRMAEFCQKAGIPQSVIDGDSWCVLGTTGLGELLFSEIQRMKTELAAANERVKELEHALSFVIPNCQWLHHEYKHLHAAGDPCPVEAIINKAKDRV